MAWVKAASLNADDVFDENGDELNLQSKEWAANMKKRVMDGYVEGVGAGEEASLQAGFNLGFREGGAQTVAVGRLKGILGAVWCWCQMQHPENPIPPSLTDLLERVTKHQEHIMENIKRTLENPPASVSDISESFDDLEVEQKDCSREEGCKEVRCCRTEEKMDVDDCLGEPNACSGRINVSSNSGESLDVLLQLSVDLVSELGLPQELVGIIQELRNLRK